MSVDAHVHTACGYLAGGLRTGLDRAAIVSTQRRRDG